MKDVSGWHYYKYAWLPNVSPDEDVDTSIVDSGEIWKSAGKKAILARWTNDFDCENETQWWYVIKDSAFDVSLLKAKRRYEITKGKKNFDVKIIDPVEYVQDLYMVQVAAYSAYPGKYRPKIDKEKWQEYIKKEWTKSEVYVFGAFLKGTRKLCGYAMLYRQRKCINFNTLKTEPESEKYAVNAAIVAHILGFFEKDLLGGCYICDGARNIQHETAFQDYLEKYFGFRKAYAYLKVKYNPHYRIFVKILYPFRRMLKKFDGVSIVHKINGVLYMEELLRMQKEKI